MAAKTAVTRLLGPACGILSAILICLVVAGSLLGNSFVAGRMAVAAANKTWLPGAFGVLGKRGAGARTGDPGTSTEDVGDVTGSPKTPASDAPINAIILSAVLSTMYILFGNFRALLTLNGLGEYSFFFLAVLGTIILRHREAGLRRPYKPLVVVPAAFAVVSGFVVVRGAMFAPTQAVILVLVWIIGLLFYWAKKQLAARRVDDASAMGHAAHPHPHLLCSNE